MDNVLRIGHGNGRNQRSLVKFARQMEWDSFSALEAQRLVRPFERMKGTRLTVPGDGFKEARDRARSTMILTRDKHESLGELICKVSERIPKAIRVAPDRVLVASFYKHPVATAMGLEGVAHFALHPVAGPRALNGNDGDVPIVREYRESMVSARKWMVTARREQLLVVLTGDLQVGDGNTRPWSPQMQIVRPLEMGYMTMGIDWIIFDGRLQVTQVMRRELADHPGFITGLESK